MHEVSTILNTGLDRQTLAILVNLCEAGVNPEALALGRCVGGWVGAWWRRRHASSLISPSPFPPPHPFHPHPHLYKPTVVQELRKEAAAKKQQAGRTGEGGSFQHN